MAERMGFEPMKEFPLYTLSKRAPSTTRPPLQIILVYYNFVIFLSFEILIEESNGIPKLEFFLR